MRSIQRAPLSNATGSESGEVCQARAFVAVARHFVELADLVAEVAMPGLSEMRQTGRYKIVAWATCVGSFRIR
jgi:hypothetical protein